MKTLHVFPFKQFLPVCILLAAILVFLMITRAERITCKTETFTESSAPLPNPYQGFYHIIGYTLSDAYNPKTDFPGQPASYTEPLVLVEINLNNYRASEISETGLSQLDDILTSWSKSPSNTKLLLRFLYDWDGLAQATEPESMDLILTHMDQISKPVNQHRKTVYLMQGIFIGNWGEMHDSHFMDPASVKTLIRHLHDIIDPSIYLSVRTPAQWRMINDLYDIPAAFPAFGTDGSLTGRLGLFNDGILGSESDLGTYGDTLRREASSPSYRGTRREELAFQEKLCSYVPNGGEVVYDPQLSDLDTSVPALRTMHVSYLNADYDSRVLEKWQNSVWTRDDAFHGCDGYDYIQAHLGYRYRIRSCKITKSGFLSPVFTLLLTLQNDGFSNTLQPFQTTVVLKNTETAERVTLFPGIDLRRLKSGQKKTFPLRLPVKELKHGSYEIYFAVKDTSDGQMILLGNQNAITGDGYLLGQLEK